MYISIIRFFRFEVVHACISIFVVSPKIPLYFCALCHRFSLVFTRFIVTVGIKNRVTPSILASRHVRSYDAIFYAMTRINHCTCISCEKTTGFRSNSAHDQRLFAYAIAIRDRSERDRFSRAPAVLESVDYRYDDTLQDRGTFATNARISTDLKTSA